MGSQLYKELSTVVVKMREMGDDMSEKLTFLVLEIWLYLFVISPSTAFCSF